MTVSAFAADVTHVDFDERVLRKSHEVPVLADFWAAWCGPCRMLMPVLAKLAEDYQGKFFLAKINSDAEQALAARYGVRSLPTVKLFRKGQVVDEFMGALPESAVRGFLDKHVPRPSDAAVEAALAERAAGRAEQALARLRQALTDDPANDRAKLELARGLLDTAGTDAGRLEDAARVLEALTLEQYNSAPALALRARVELARYAAEAPGLEELQRSVAANGASTQRRFQLGVRRVLAGEHDRGMEDLLEIVKQDRKFGDDAARKALLASFELLGPQDERVKKYRGLLARSLY